MRKAVHRLGKKGYLTRVGRRLYANHFGAPRLEALAMILGTPCYISFESALERYGILSQVPLVLTCASTSRSERCQTALGEVLFHRLRPTLFFGYRVENHILWAEPEKALLDWLYIHRRRHGATPPLDELNRASLNQPKGRPSPTNSRGRVSHGGVLSLSKRRWRGRETCQSGC